MNERVNVYDLLESDGRARAGGYEEAGRLVKNAL